MNQSFYIGATGAVQQQRSMNVTGNNIANVNTYGFKVERSRFTNLLYQNLETVDSGNETMGTGAAVGSTTTIFRNGGVAWTGRKQDYMIEGNGFFAVQNLETGEITLTRNGAFCLSSLRKETGRLDANGNPEEENVYYLSDGNGRFVLGQDGGLIEVKDPNEQHTVGVFDCENYNGMLHEDGTRFSLVVKNGELHAASGQAVQGALENSNADLGEQMTHVIEAQRAYSMALRIMTTSDEIETAINNLRG